jgi:hypothetical protein
MAMGYLFKIIRSSESKGPAGVVEVPYLGAKVGELANWTLTRRGDEEPESSLYNLRATFTFVTEALWDDSDYPKEITLNLNPKKQYRLQQAEGFSTVRSGRSLLMEGVTIHGV